MIDSLENLVKSQLFTLKGEVIEGDASGNKQGQTRQYRRHTAGQVIDQKFKIIGLLGEGGMGAVYKAHHLLLKKDVALKTFRSPNLTEDSWARFQREAQAIARLTHPNIVHVFDFGVDEDNIPYYTMECLVGESLADRLQKRGHLPLAEAIPIFWQVCQGLSLAHSKGIIHRDLKPANIFLAQSGSGDNATDMVKIVDFGIAGLASQSLDDQKLTSTGSIFGSPLYMSPEQSMGLKMSERSDIYSCGCALYETLTGTPPFRGENAFATMLQHQQNQAPGLASTTQGGEFPQRLIALTARMLAKSEDQRIQSFDQVAADLKEILIAHKLKNNSRSSQSDLTEEIDGRAQHFPHRRQPVGGKWTFAILGLALAVFAVSYVFRTGLIKPSPEVAHVQSLAAPTKSPDTVTDVPHYLQSSDPGGDQGRRFVFPEKQSLGLLQWHIPGKKSAPPKGPNFWEAKGKVDVPARAQLDLTAGPSLSIDPEQFKGFGANDLEWLVLDINSVWTNKHLSYVGKLTGLKSLRIEGEGIDDGSIDDLNQLTKLHSLAIKGTNFTATGLASLKILPHLSTFWATGVHHISEPLTHLNASLLTELQLEDCSLTDCDMKAIEKMTRLRWLSICDSHLKGAALANLTVLPKLQVLGVREIDNISATLEKISHSGILELQLVDCHLADADMKLIGSMPNLQELTLRNNAKLTNVGLQSIANLKRLKMLCLSGTGITPGCVATLQGLSSLRTLKVDWPREVRSQLRNSLRKCIIVKDGTDDNDVYDKLKNSPDAFSAADDLWNRSDGQ